MDRANIVMNIVDKHGKIIDEDIFHDKKSTWFDNLAGSGNNEVYHKLKLNYGKLKNAEYPADEFYFNFRFFKVSDFRDWYIKYRPNINVGWVNTRTKWLIENRDYYPETIKEELPVDVNPADWHFIEYKDKEDCSEWLYNYLYNSSYLYNRKVEEDAYIVYYFYYYNKDED